MAFRLYRSGLESRFCCSLPVVSGPRECAEVWIFQRWFGTMISAPMGGIKSGKSMGKFDPVLGRMMTAYAIW
jgi:hypothetical protein